MKSYQCLGVDPGLANTGIAVVSVERGGYRLLSHRLVKTRASLATGDRLSLIASAVLEMLDVTPVSLVAVERVFHNKNVSSSISTGKVIGVCELVAHDFGVPCELITPQVV